MFNTSNHDTITLGTTPADEPCAQVGHSLYRELCRIERNAFRAQIERHYPRPDALTDADVRIRVQANAHDFGIYFDLEIVYDGSNPAAVEYAYSIEEDAKHLLLKWDDKALAQLRQTDYFTHIKRES